MKLYLIRFKTSDRLWVVICWLTICKAANELQAYMFARRKYLDENVTDRLISFDSNIKEIKLS